MRRGAELLITALLLSVATESTAQLRRNSVVRVEATAYCIEGETASGAQTRKGIVAADPDVMPLGSRIRVDGLDDVDGLERVLSRTYDVEDTGRLIKGRIIDIFMHSCDDAKEFGRRTAMVRVLEVGENDRVDQRTND